MEKESLAVNCSFCRQQMECPKEMLDKVEKHMCGDCFKNIEEIAPEEDLGKVHIDIPRNQFDEIVVNRVVNKAVEELFPEMWQERKEELKGLSKRDLAREMFGAGAYLALRGFLESMKEIDKKTSDEEIPEKN